MALLANIFWDTLSELLNTVPLDIRQNVWFMHGDVPANFSYTTRNYLVTAYTRWWVGRQGPISLPSCSPDLNPLDYFLWVCMLQWWILQKNHCSTFRMAVPWSTTFLEFFSTFISPWIIEPELVWQCKSNILCIYCDPDNNCYLLSLECESTYLVRCCIISWREILLLITFVWHMFNLSCYVIWHKKLLLQMKFTILLLQGTPWWLCFIVELGRR
jgi:hypothetical protein